MSKSWGDVFNFYKHQGHDPSSAAAKADEWEKHRPWNRCPNTHCERAQECRSRGECCAVKIAAPSEAGDMRGKETGRDC